MHIKPRNRGDNHCGETAIRKCLMEVPITSINYVSRRQVDYPIVLDCE